MLSSPLGTLAQPAPQSQGLSAWPLQGWDRCAPAPANPVQVGEFSMCGHLGVCGVPCPRDPGLDEQIPVSVSSLGPAL